MAWWQTRRFAALLILLSTVPLWWPGIAPITDLPGHIGRFRVMLGDDPNLAQWYRFEWRLAGNLGIDLIVRALAPLVGLEPATKLAVLAIPALTASGLLSISRAVHGRIQPLAFVALPLAYGYPFQFGFVNYCLSVGLALNAFALWLHLAERTRLRAALFVPVATLVWLAHAVGWGILGVLVLGAELARDRHPRALLRTLPLCLPFALMLWWRADDGDGITERFFDFRLKAAWLATVFRDRWQLFDLASAALAAMLLYRSWRDPRDTAASALIAGSVLLLIVFVLMPFTLLVSAYADARLAPVLWMIALLTMRSHPRHAHRIALIGLAFFLVRTTATTVGYARESAAWDRRLATLSAVPPGTRLVSFIGTHCPAPWAGDRRTHLPSLALARRRAFANDQWRLEGGSPLTIVAGGIGRFAADPSQMVVAQGCRAYANRTSLDRALARLPRDRFDMIWVVDPPEGGPVSALYRIHAPERLSAQPRPQ